MVQMPPDANNSCLTCRKRQVRCDGSRPTCTRCPKDGLDCRGYKGQLRIVQVNPTKPTKTVARRKPKVVLETDPAFEFWLSKHIFISERDLWTLVDCAAYWNSNVIPSTFPAERPFFRPLIKGDEVIQQPLPKVCLHFVIVAFRSTQAAKLLIDPLTQPDLCYYRGLGLRELAGHLEDAATDPSGVALMSIIMLLTSDLLTTDGAWLAHLEAARRIVTLRGGVEACITTLPDASFVLVQLFVIDTLTSTTCDSAKLPSTSLADMISDIPNVDFQLITCATTCPAVIFEAIANTSSLRRQQLDDRRLLSSEAGSPVDRSRFDTLLDNLNTFDCAAWAVKISQLGLLHPITESNVAPCSSTAGLTSIAECFRSAAQIYLLLSCSTKIDAEVMKMVRDASKLLYGELDVLFDIASLDWNGPLDTQMWKFATWPLVIASYAWVGWDVVGSVDLETLFDRLDMIAANKATQPRSTARQDMREVRARRAKYPRLRWKWDMGFPERRALVL